ncbi:SMI1/KNR4 family protein [Leptothoe kymatousa]|uniref:SMI1/KNR4 family protein n=1 Tax=Leptothoe kymatousa TAU-MAC 1615 TaxID=2364775 RepID=A0ABS5Y7P0_9CYAN|nr:SMI1/KNR4 family protein [Leptothoe kymatousa]MBT9312970.1 SMI1/KNR4 family protein [Leptothoe kymatousa TAU-MAC 1615]
MNIITRLRMFEWQMFLEKWSREFIESASNIDQIPHDVLESGWLGYPGATEEQIRQAESRLRIRLPPSYRDFLKVSNGWRQMTPFIYRVWSVEQIDWFFSRHQTWIEAFINKQLKSINRLHYNFDRCHPTPIDDADYLLYGEAQDCRKVRYEYLKTALEISDKGESTIYLLNPQVRNDEGEWEAWFFGDWLPGADRYPSFREMMEAEYVNFLEMREIL